MTPLELQIHLAPIRALMITALHSHCIIYEVKSGTQMKHLKRLTPCIQCDSIREALDKIEALLEVSIESEKPPEDCL